MRTKVVVFLKLGDFKLSLASLRSGIMTLPWLVHAVQHRVEVVRARDGRGHAVDGDDRGADVAPVEASEAAILLDRRSGMVRGRAPVTAMAALAYRVTNVAPAGRG